MERSKILGQGCSKTGFEAPKEIKACRPSYQGINQQWPGRDIKIHLKSQSDP